MSAQPFVCLAGSLPTRSSVAYAGTAADKAGDRSQAPAAAGQPKDQPVPPPWGDNLPGDVGSPTLRIDGSPADIQNMQAHMKVLVDQRSWSSTMDVTTLEALWPGVFTKLHRCRALDEEDVQALLALAVVWAPDHFAVAKAPITVSSRKLVANKKRTPTPHPDLEDEEYCVSGDFSMGFPDGQALHDRVDGKRFMVGAVTFNGKGGSSIATFILDFNTSFVYIYYANRLDHKATVRLAAHAIRQMLLAAKITMSEDLRVFAPKATKLDDEEKWGCNLVSVFLLCLNLNGKLGASLSSDEDVTLEYMNVESTSRIDVDEFSTDGSLHQRDWDIYQHLRAGVPSPGSRLDFIRAFFGLMICDNLGVPQGVYYSGKDKTSVLSWLPASVTSKSAAADSNVTGDSGFQETQALAEFRRTVWYDPPRDGDSSHDKSITTHKPDGDEMDVDYEMEDDVIGDDIGADVQSVANTKPASASGTTADPGVKSASLPVLPKWTVDAPDPEYTEWMRQHRDTIEREQAMASQEGKNDGEEIGDEENGDEENGNEENGNEENGNEENEDEENEDEENEDEENEDEESEDEESEYEESDGNEPEDEVKVNDAHGDEAEDVVMVDDAHGDEAEAEVMVDDAHGDEAEDVVMVDDVHGDEAEAEVMVDDVHHAKGKDNASDPENVERMVQQQVIMEHKQALGGGGRKE